MTIVELDGFLALLRRHGVKSFNDDVNSIAVEFLPPTPTDAPTAKSADEDVCRCGHKSYEHGPLCLHGCDPMKCAPEEA